MKLGIVGGALQGIEAAYLAQKAGYETLVLDRREDAPARSIADGSVTVDVAKDPEKAAKALGDCDAVIPALEEMDALESLEKIKGGFAGPYLFDIDAYRISSSKLRSNEIMGKFGVPMPKPWPECGYPVIVKPSSQSGSVGVSEVENDEQMKAALEKVSALHDEPVVQEFVHGKSLSVEAIGDGEKARAYVTTQVVLDSGYDCKQVICDPGILSPEADEKFGECIRMTAEDMHLRGLMDMEAIGGNAGFKVLEIDARIPSQTPACILAGTGINLLKELYLTLSGRGSDPVRRPGASSYEHFYIDGARMYTTGEKAFSHVESPRIEKGLFGSDEMITDYAPGRSRWHATMITSGKDREEVFWKRKDAIARIMDECGIEEFIDGSPEVV
ncbi:MAG: 3-methylornithine--L-lysine ligase PylC [Methanomethylophilus alvi]|nr:MAG: 3-methylornithine--L-lysine ligase PylC [Methanomethylophilus alvi]